MAEYLMEETPISRFYCEAALRWLSWMGEAAPPDETSVHPREFAGRFERVRDLERTRGNDRYVSCLFSHYLFALDDYVKGTESVGVSVPSEVRAIYPAGIDEPLLSLARRTSDPRARAALLLSEAPRMIIRDFSEPHALVREAKAVDSATSIQLGAASAEFVWMNMPDHKGKVETLALDLIDRFPDREIACEACSNFWQALVYPWPEFTNRIPQWKQKCLALINRCPDRVDRWIGLALSVPSDHERAREVYEILLASGPPDEAVPRILLQLSDAVRATEPERAWQLERRAIRHPQFPGLRSDGDHQSRAESNEDFETALFLELLSGRSLVGGCIPGDRSGEIVPKFRRAYYWLRLEVDPHEHWQELIELLGTSPENPTSRALHRRDYFDRLVAASRVVDEEQAALERFRSLRQRYRAVLGSDQAVEQMLSAYIVELEESTRQPAAGTTGP